MGSVNFGKYRDFREGAFALPHYTGTDTLLHRSLEKSELFLTSNSSGHLHEGSNQASLRIGVTFIDKDGEEHNFQVAQGDNLLDIAQSEDLEMEGTGFLHAFCYHLTDGSHQELVADPAPVQHVMLS